VFDFQLCRLDPLTLELRLGDAPRAQQGCAARAQRALQQFLRTHGAPQVQVQLSEAPPGARGRSGKLKRVLAEAEAAV
jgi:hypothetical protein